MMEPAGDNPVEICLAVQADTDKRECSSEIDSGIDENLGSLSSSSESPRDETDLKNNTVIEEDSDEDSLVLKRTKNQVSGIIDDYEDEANSLKDSNIMINEEQEAQPMDKKPTSDSDNFDAEDNSANDSGDDAQNDGKEYEDFDDSELTPAMRARLQKGAAKKPKNRKSQSQKKDEIIQLHSETHRLIRESRLKLPYHQPASKSLDDFLSRASRKQHEYRAVKGSGEQRKVAFVQKIIFQDKKERKPFGNASTEGTKAIPECCKPVADTESFVSSEKSLGEQLKDKIPSSTFKENNSPADTDDELPDLNVGCTASVVSDNLFPCVVNSSSGFIDSVQRLKHEECLDSLAKSQPDLECPLAVVKDGVNEHVCSQWKLGNLNNENENIVSVLQKETKLNTEKKDTEASLDVDEMPKNQVAEADGEDDIQTYAVDDKKLSKQLQLTPKLASLSNLDMKLDFPMLKGTPNNIIYLDNDSAKDSNVTPRNPGLEKLVKRFMEHSMVKKAQRVEEEVDISVVQKEKSESGKEELKLNTFTYNREEVKENPFADLETPGAKLQALKGQLQQQMKLKRDEARQKRCELWTLDNEEGFEEEGDGLPEEEEAEMTDSSETDFEDDEFTDEEYLEEEKPRKRNPFADDEAEESKDEDEQENSNSEDERENSNEESADGGVHLELQLSDDNSEELFSLRRKKTKALKIIDDDETTNDHLIADAAGNKVNKPIKFSSTEDSIQISFAGALSKVGLTPISKQDSLVVQSRNMKRMLRLAPPVEDSQDLYKSSSIDLLSPPHETQPSNKLSSFMEESQASPLLDEDGLLRVRGLPKKPVNRLQLQEIGTSQDNMEELLGLCSGSFVDAEDGRMKSSCRSLFTDHGSLSSVFSLNTVSEETQSSETKRLQPKETEFMNLQLLSDGDEDFEMKIEKDELEDSDKENVNGDDDKVENQSLSEEKRFGKQKYRGFTYGNKHGKFRKEYIEDEAELSGSEWESDENLEIPEEEDILELEEGDMDVKLTEEELREQVGRVHLKRMIDEDKRELYRFQEMYLPDGDLYSENGGRTRRFRWKNIDENSQQDMFGKESDDETRAEEEIESEIKWRVERYEREKWIKEQQNENHQEDNNQFLKFAKIFLKRKDRSFVVDEKLISKDGKVINSPGTLLKSKRKGSFLTRSKACLAQIAELTKPVSKPTGPTNSRKFVFTVVSPQKVQSSKTNTEPLNYQPVKRQKLMKSTTLSQDSIFNHL